MHTFKNATVVILGWGLLCCSLGAIISKEYDGAVPLYRRASDEEPPMSPTFANLDDIEDVGPYSSFPYQQLPSKNDNLPVQHLEQHTPANEHIEQQSASLTDTAKKLKENKERLSDRQRKYRQKLKSDPKRYKMFREKHAEAQNRRMRRFRAKIKELERTGQLSDKQKEQIERTRFKSRLRSKKHYDKFKKKKS
ncbi:uncharacterized protein FA14DRAFT_186013 [Meira miltonrushii]|uniref:Uncharacterized protein n=1 Tax=Meira miltonrushii TaxID=1280837 RepID=A0A316V7P4_9BASI|nr:uncharacterized protein FA14DRAFT_186013 [Meira miltonrushii]PWN32233.1 hypothetical protein FA14DRAFT_186013 [Meira miltonrushii]